MFTSIGDLLSQLARRTDILFIIIHEDDAEWPVKLRVAAELAPTDSDTDQRYYTMNYTGNAVRLPKAWATVKRNPSLIDRSGIFRDGSFSVQ